MKPEILDEYVINPSAIVNATIVAKIRRKGSGTVSLDLGDQDHLLLAEIVTKARFADQPVRLSRVDARIDQECLRTLVEAGIAIRPVEIPAKVATTIDLDEIYGDSCAFGDCEEAPVDPRFPFVPNPEVASYGDAVGAELGIAYRWALDELGITKETLIVRDPQTLVVMPVRLSAELRSSWNAIQVHRDAGRLDPKHVRMLTGARLLIAQGAHCYVRDAAVSLVTRRYCILRNVYGPAFSHTLRTYAMSLHEAGELEFLETQNGCRWVKHNDVVMQATHAALAPLVSAITSRTRPGGALPTYSYLAVYERNSHLSVHRDRPECRWNISLCLGSVPHVPRAHEWPILLEVDGGMAEIRLGPGDGVLYSGTAMSHGRRRLDTADRCAICLMHFVDRDFKGVLR